MRTAWLLAVLVGCAGDRRPRRDDAPAPRPADAAVAHARADAAAPPAKPQPAGRVEHAVWHLVDNRHAAHRAIGDDVVLDAGDIGFARFIRFGVPVARWHLGHVVDGERAAIADRLASLEVPLGADAARTATQVVARVHGDGKQTLTLKINGRKAGKRATIAVDAGWQTLALPIEPGRLGAGDNQLVFETGGRGSLAFAWLRIGDDRSGGVDDPRAAARFDRDGDAIELADGAQLAWYVTVPDGANVVAEVGGACRVEVRARASDDSFAGGVLGGDASRVDLAAMAGRVVRLSLTARECPRARIVHPRVTLHGGEPHEQPTAEPPRYVILWVWDAVRADHIPLFTPGARTQTPVLDELAKSGAVFRQYYVQGNESQTSHSSLFTSLYPAVHGVRLAGDGGVSFIRKTFPVLAGELADDGYYTLATTGNGYVNEDGGYARGFKEFRNPMRFDDKGRPNSNPVILGKTIVDLALKRFDAHRDQPTFLFLGTIDNHSPWIARKPWIDLYSPGPYKGPFKELGTAEGLGLRADSMGCSIIPPKEDIERMRAIYDSANQLPGSRARPRRRPAEVVGDLGQDDARHHRRPRRRDVRGRPLRPRRLAARVARARAAARPRPGAVPGRHRDRRGRRGDRPRADDPRRDRAAAVRRRAGPVAAPRRPGARSGLAAAELRVDVRVRARDARRALEDPRRPDRRGDDR